MHSDLFQFAPPPRCFSVGFSQDNEKRTPLHAAAYLGDAEIIELLILSGVFFNKICVLKNQSFAIKWIPERKHKLETCDCEMK